MTCPAGYYGRDLDPFCAFQFLVRQRGGTLQAYSTAAASGVATINRDVTNIGTTFPTNSFRVLATLKDQCGSECNFIHNF
jgi:hypothetical protein